MHLSKIFYITASIIIFLILSLYFLHPIPMDIQNSDLGRHLLLGKIIVTSGKVPLINLLSYTFTNYPFINTHWLSEVVFYLWYSIFGFNGLIILSIGISVVTLAFVFISSFKKIDPFAAVFIALIYLQIYFERAEVRPEIFSILLLAIFIVILYKYREKYTKWIFALIPLELLWVNLHIYFFVGIAVLLLFLLDTFIAKQERFTSQKKITLAFVTSASGLATLCNPNFIKGATYPLLVLHNYGVSIQENDNFFLAASLYKDTSFFFFELALFILWISILFAWKKMYAIDIFLSLLFTFLGIFAVRDFTLFVIGSFIPAVKSMSSILYWIANKFPKRDTSSLKKVFLSFILVLLIPTIKSNIDIHGIGFGVNDNAQKGIDFLTKTNLTGPVYNNFTVGNYLEYRLYPNEKVFVDGRPEAYPLEFFQNIYYPMQTSQALFNKEDNKYHFTIIFLDHTDVSESQLINELSKSNKWKMVFLNNLIVIFVKNIPSNQSVIKTYHVDQSNIKISNADMNDKNKVRQLANFFKTVGWDKKQLEMTFRYLQFDPKNCNAIETAAYFLQKEHSPEFQEYYNLYMQTCSQ